MFEDLVFGALGLGFRSCLGLWEGETQVVGFIVFRVPFDSGLGLLGCRISALAGYGFRVCIGVVGCSVLRVLFKQALVQGLVYSQGFGRVSIV